MVSEVEFTFVRAKDEFFLAEIDMNLSTKADGTYEFYIGSFTNLLSEQSKKAYLL